MKHIRVNNPRRVIFFAVLVFVLSLVLLFYAQDVIRELFVFPLSYLAWFVGVFVDRTSQVFFWIVVLLFGILIAYHSLAGRRKTDEMLPADIETNGYSRPLRGQVALWQLKVELVRGSTSPYFNRSFHQAVGRLLLDCLAYRYRLTSSQVEARLREGSLGVPIVVREYALFSLRRLEVEQSGLVRRWFDEWFSALRAWLRGLIGGADKNETASRQYTQDEQKIKAILSYLEAELEVPNDDTGI